MSEYGYAGSYQAVKRLVQRLRGPRRPEPAGIILTAPGEGGQVDYGSGSMRRYERASTRLTSNRPVEDWGKLLGDSAAVTVMLDRLLHHGHILKCGPRSWRTKTDLPDQEKSG